jgi:hypothetical protein
MPINYAMFSRVLETAMLQLIHHKGKIGDSILEAEELFQHPPLAHAELRQRSDHLFASMARMMRWAGPVNEPFNAQFPPPELPVEMVLIAVDGSQRNPDPGEGISWGSVNTAAIVWPRKACQYEPIEIFTVTNLFLENQLFTDEGARISEEHISLIRDINELEILDQKAMEHQPAVLAIRDGPLELWGAYDANLSGEYLPSLEKARSIYTQMCEQNLPYCGYIDSARTDLLIRLLEIALTADLPLAAFRENWKNRRFPGVTDCDLLWNWLSPGYRTAVFRLMTQAKGSYAGFADLGIYLFYINTGTEDSPHIARIEIPGWLAHEPDMVGMVHAMLLAQCRLCERAPYPYILARADEEARISQADILLMQQMIVAEYLRFGDTVPAQSAKRQFKMITRRWQNEF